MGKQLTIKEALLKLGEAAKDYTDKNKFSGSYDDLTDVPEQATNNEVNDILTSLFDN